MGKGCANKKGKQGFKPVAAQALQQQIPHPAGAIARIPGFFASFGSPAVTHSRYICQQDQAEVRR
jgi:hypothetical protein